MGLSTFRVTATSIVSATIKAGICKCADPTSSQALWLDLARRVVDLIAHVGLAAVVLLAMAALVVAALALRALQLALKALLARGK